MKNDNIHSILSDLAENARPAGQIDLWPGLQKYIAASDGRSKPEKSIMNKASVLRRAAFAALAVLAALAILLVTPQGQTLAQALLKYFTTISQRSIPPVSPSMPVPTYALKVGLVPQPPVAKDHQNCGGTISSISSTFDCQLRDAQVKLGFVVKSFPARYVQAPFVFM